MKLTSPDFRPLYQRTVVAANQFPTHVAADAAYDYWYVYVRRIGACEMPA